MYVKSIKIVNFRNYKDEIFNFNKNINIIYGNNAQGKTNLLESIYFLALGKSHRSLNDKDLIKNGENECKVSASTYIKDLSTSMEIKIQNNRKVYKIDNNYIKSLTEYLSNLKVIIFFPEDLDIIKTSPDVRRRYLNIQISQLNKLYFKTLNEYNKLLKIRNDLLKKNLKDGYLDTQYFDIITNYLIEKASYIYIMRDKYIEKINKLIDKYYENISTYKKLHIKYITNIELDNYDNIKKLMKEKFDKLRSAELSSGITLIGPQKDDFEFILEDKNLKNYGSQGQQRMAVLALKLTEIEIFTKESEDTPILLLDDVFSELDDYKKNNLLNILDESIQTIITTTDLNNIDKKILEKANLIEIEDGKCVTRGE